jgi:PX domain-containing protein kinase-like protein
LKKYSVQKKYQTFPIDTFKQIAKRLLLTIQFIHSKGLFHGHLHTGNVLYEASTNSIKLTDMLNSLLGLPYFYRPYVLQYKKIQNMEQVDVYGFGHVLYEMYYGQQMLASSSKLDFNDCTNRELKHVLDLILSEDLLVKQGPPTLSQLLELPFFKYTNLVDELPTSSSAAAALSTANNKLFTSTRVKENFIRLKEFVEKRMNEEQKQVFTEQIYYFFFQFKFS